MAKSPRLTIVELASLTDEALDLCEVVGKEARSRQVEIAYILNTRKWPYRTQHDHYHLHQAAAHVGLWYKTEGKYEPSKRLPIKEMVALADEAYGLQFLPGEAARERQSEIGQILAASLHLLECWELTQIRHTISRCAEGDWFEEPQPDLTPDEIAALDARRKLDDELPI